MNDLAIHCTPGLLTVVPRRELSIRVATMDDLPFMDALQKQHSKQLGFFPRAQMEGYVTNEWVLIAEDASTRTPLGYCASRDRYLKRDELGVIYQLCVAPGHQRGLIGATLIREVFARSAYGCRLYCCWCAQDLDANHFWESLGFVPIAFRGGSGKKKRVHIFWQRRIDTELPIADCQASNESNSNRKSQIGNWQSPTPYWFPAKTDQGAMREDRLVLPIPPGLHWSDPMPVLVGSSSGETPKPRRASGPQVGEKGGPQEPTKKPSAAVQFSVPTARPVVAVEPSEPTSEPKQKPAKPPRPKALIDPQMVAKGRELRDRYLEQVNAGAFQLESRGRYDVSRALPAPSATQLSSSKSIREAQPAIPLLPAA